LVVYSVGENGIMETAYEITDINYEQYFLKPGYYFLGTIKEVVNFDRTNESSGGVLKGLHSTNVPSGNVISC
jgi:hypothetical protein